MLHVSVNDSCHSHCYQHKLFLIFLPFPSARSVTPTSMRLPRETGVRVPGFSEVGGWGAGKVLTMSFIGQHLLCQGLQHTTATSLQDGCPFSPGQNRLKLPLTPGCPPPPYFTLEPDQNSRPIQGQLWAEHHRAPNSLLDDDAHIQGFRAIARGQAQLTGRLHPGYSHLCLSFSPASHT